MLIGLSVVIFRVGLGVFWIGVGVSWIGVGVVAGIWIKVVSTWVSGKVVISLEIVVSWVRVTSGSTVAIVTLVAVYVIKTLPSCCFLAFFSGQGSSLSETKNV